MPSSSKSSGSPARPSARIEYMMRSGCSARSIALESSISVTTADYRSNPNRTGERAGIAGDLRRKKMQLSNQRCVPVGADADDLDGDAHELFQRLDVLLRFFGKLLKTSAAADVAVPTLQRFVDGLDFSQHFHVGTEVIEALALIAIAGANLDAIEAGEYIEQRQGNYRGAAQIGRVSRGDRVKPA